MAPFNNPLAVAITSVLVTHQLRDAFYVSDYEAVHGAEGVEFRQASEQKANEAEFIMLKDGRVHFEGNSRELRATRDEYISTFLS